jgi:uncharacterized membrane protein
MANISPIIRFWILLLFLQSITLACKQASPEASQTYICSGNEPFWMVKIEPDSVLFKTPENEISYPSATFKREKETLVFETQLAHATMSSKLKIKLLATKCTDSMSGFESAYTVTVEKDGETYTGCGRVER